ncbi:hypothetical protein ACFYOG_35600 [Streptomyces sp. NPDC007818]
MGSLFGVLTFMTGNEVAPAVAAGFTAFGVAVAWLHKHVGS